MFHGKHSTATDLPNWCSCNTGTAEVGTTEINLRQQSKHPGIHALPESNTHEARNHAVNQRVMKHGFSCGNSLSFTLQKTKYHAAEEKMPYGGKKNAKLQKEICHAAKRVMRHDENKNPETISLFNRFGIFLFSGAHSVLSAPLYPLIFAARTYRFAESHAVTTANITRLRATKALKTALRITSRGTPMA